jgi:hypothetical protein
MSCAHSHGIVVGIDDRGWRMNFVRRTTGLVLVGLLVSCSTWEACQYEAVEGGYWVTLAQPGLDGAPADGATTVCINRVKLQSCPRSTSLAYIYRPTDLKLVITGKLVEIWVEGGDVSGPASGKDVTVGDHDELVFRIVRKPQRTF